MIPNFAEIHAFSDVEDGGKKLWSYSEGGGGGLTAAAGTVGKGFVHCRNGYFFAIL